MANGNDGASGGYDYGRMRRRMLESWGKKDSAPVPEKEAPATEKIKKGASVFKVKQKSVTIGTDKGQSRIQKPAVSKRAEVLPKRAAVKPSVPAVSAVKRQSPVVSGVQETQERQHRGIGLSGNPVFDARQWVIYDAVFGLPRSRRPWKPFR